MRQARDSDVSSGDADKPRVFRVGGNLLFAVFGTEPARTAGFYEAVFGWSLRGDRPTRAPRTTPRFGDSTAPKHSIVARETRSVVEFPRGSQVAGVHVLDLSGKSLEFGRS